MRSATLILASIVCLSAGSSETSPTTEQPSLWKSAGPWGGSTTAVALDAARPQRMMLGGRNSLIYLSGNAGLSWRRLGFPRHFLGTIRAASFDPSDERVLLAAVNGEQSGFGGIWRSEDLGESWQLPETIAGQSAEALVRWARDPRVLLAGTHAGVWQSEDGGQTWERISPPWNHEMRVITAVAIDPSDRRILYAGTPHLPWKSEDGGKTWRSIHEGMLDDSDVFSIFIDPARPSRIMASACSGIYRSETAGAKWQKFAGIPASHRRTHVIRQHPSQPGVIYAGTTLGLLRSTDNGVTFRQLNKLHILSMVFHPQNPQVLYMATESAGLWKSEDGGVTATAVNEGFVNRKVLNVAASGERLLLNTSQEGTAGGVFESGDGGRSWTLRSSVVQIGDNHIHHISGDAFDERLIYAANERRVYKTADGGKTWKPLASPQAGRDAAVRISALMAARSKDGSQLLLGTDHGLWRSMNGGAAWTLVAVTKADRMPRVLGLYSAGERLLVRTASALYISNDSGQTWSPVALLLPTSIIYDIALPAEAKDPILLATARGLYASEDGGRTWNQWREGLEDGTVSTVRFQTSKRGRVWLVQFGQLYESADSGRHWRRVEGGKIEESPIRALWADPRQPERVFALTPDIGVFYLDLDGEKLHNSRKAGQPKL